MKVFINPGHDLVLDPGAYGHNLKEAEIVHQVGQLVEKYLTLAGVQVVGNIQDDDLRYICSSANQSGADIFIIVSSQLYVTVVSSQ